MPLADSCQQIHKTPVLLDCFRREALDPTTQIKIAESGFLIDLAGEETFAERTVRHETNPEFLDRGNDLGLRFAGPKRVLALQRGDRLHGVGAPDLQAHSLCAPIRTNTTKQEHSMSALKLLSVNVGMPREVDWHGKLVRTSIFKSPVSGPVRVGTLNLDGDQQSDLTVHGGVHKAVY